MLVSNFRLALHPRLTVKINEFNFIFSLDQVVGTAILVLSIMAITDKKNKVADGIAPIFIGLTIGAVGMSFGHNCGFSLNPARDFGPR